MAVCLGVWAKRQRRPLHEVHNRWGNRPAACW